jgi:hypothetical protein
MGLADRRPHRKLWEFVYILQVLRRFGALREGMRGLGFGVGQERLPAVMAAAGCTVLATDLPADDARATAWTGSTQHSAGLDGLRFPDVCPDEVLERRVCYRPVDMGRIPRDLRDFDFAWSSCAFEHLGSIAAGLRFVERSLACVKPGGIVVHTTELNLTSDTETVARGDTVLFRRRDMEALARRLRRQGHWVAPIKYDAGEARLDDYVDVPPYVGDAQLKIALSGFVTTSFGLVVRRGPRRPLLARLFG